MIELGLVALVVIAGLLIIAASRPDSFRIQRALSIKASPERIFALINNFHEWEAWSPWEKVDPSLKRTYSGAPLGKGAVYEWNGNKSVGQGRMEIVDSSLPTKVVIKIDFVRPIEAHNTLEFKLAMQSDFTTVTQAMYGPSPFISKVMGLFFSMDKMVGQKFEEGLAAIKFIAEK